VNISVGSVKGSKKSNAEVDASSGEEEEGKRAYYRKQHQGKKRSRE